MNSVPDVKPLKAVYQFALHRGMKNTYPGPFFRGPGDNPVELLSELRLQ